MSKKNEILSELFSKKIELIEVIEDIDKKILEHFNLELLSDDIKSLELCQQSTMITLKTIALLLQKGYLISLPQ